MLYTPNDAGIVGHAEKLSKALEAWEAKRTEGEFAKDKDVALKDAESKQDGAMTDDQLAMAFPLDEHARAVERADALLGHIAAHAHHYSYALFQALTPSEQVSRILAASGGQLQVGLFEPRVVAMHGERLAAGTKVQMLFASANRDPNAFPQPERFIIDRDRREVGRHVAFGWGIHFCIGAPLARLEARIALDRVLDRMHHIHLAGKPERNDSFVLHGLTRLPIAWSPSP